MYSLKVRIEKIYKLLLLDNKKEMQKIINFLTPLF